MYFYKFWNIVIQSDMKLELADTQIVEEGSRIYTLHFDSKSNCPRGELPLKVYDEGNMLVGINHFEGIITFYGNVSAHVVTLVIISDLLADIISYFNRCLLLHASAVSKENKSIAFVGKSHSGKSTLSSYFALMGYKILTDDVCPVIKVDDAFYTVALQTGVKLRDESVAEMNQLCTNSKLFSINEKCHLFDCTDSSLFPLSAVFIIEKSDEISVQQIVGIEKKVQFVRHIHRYVDKTVLSEYMHFDFRSIEVFRLGYPRNYDMCKSVYTLVESQLQKFEI